MTEASNKAHTWLLSNPEPKIVDYQDRESVLAISERPYTDAQKDKIIAQLQHIVRMDTEMMAEVEARYQEERRLHRATVKYYQGLPRTKTQAKIASLEFDNARLKRSLAYYKTELKELGESIDET